MRLFILFVALAILLVSVQAADLANSILDSEIKVDEAGTLPAKSEASRLFHFEPFKRAYHKHYQSTMEEMRRLKTYLARCYQIFVSAVSYSRGLKSYFLRVSEWTDLLPEEIEAGKNKFASLTKPRNAEMPRGDNDGNTGKKEALVEPNGQEEQLAAKHSEVGEEPELELLAEELVKLNQLDLDRTKRNRLGVRPGFSPRQAFALKTDEDLVREQPADSIKQPGSGRQLVDYTKSSGWKEINPAEIDHGFGRNYDDLPVKGKHTRLSWLSVMAREFQGESRLAKSGAQDGARREEEGSSDVLWVDHRQDGCIQPVQNQGNCGSCYAFAVLAFMEWYHCHTTKIPIKLSEQFMVDCGPQLYEYLHGCQGGNIVVANEFITNFGLEMAQHYPYFGHENQCPYEPGREMDSIGYLRADASKVLMVEMEFAENYIDKWPLLIDMQTVGDFLWYGGGVWSSGLCDHSGNHIVMIVGHGREDGEEYWLIRNSHGSSWGEQGHMKLNKNSKCIDSYAFIFGTTTGDDSSMSISRNDKVPKPVQLKPSLLSSIKNPVLALRSMLNTMRAVPSP